MPDEITIDGLEEHAFRRSIEAMLRHGRADDAAARLRALLPNYAGPGKPLPERLLDIRTGDLHFTGLDRIADRLEEYGRAQTPITAVGIGISDPQDVGLAPDEQGLLRPPLQTTYYSDATFPFSEADRDDLLEGYSSFGCEWQGDFDQIDDAIAVEGIDDLYGAIAALENRVGASGNPSPNDICAGAVGACYLGVLVYQSAREAVMAHGLPRPLAILLVNSDAYPFFDAPVLTCDEYCNDGEVKVIESAPAMAGESEWDAEEADLGASLVSMSISTSHVPRKKQMALVLDGAEAHNPLGMADELISQAAFEPGSIDLSRFMPQGEFVSGPDESEGIDLWAERQEAFAQAEGRFEARLGGGGHNEDADGEADADFAELEFPVDALLPAHRDALRDDADEAAPLHDAPFETPGDIPPADFGGAASEPETFAGEPDYESAPDWAGVPDWASADVREPPRNELDDIDSEFERSRDAAMPLSGHETGLSGHFTPTQAPASHSIRAKVRLNQPVEDKHSGLAKFVLGIAAFAKRVQELLLRR